MGGRFRLGGPEPWMCPAAFLGVGDRQIRLLCARGKWGSPWGDNPLTPGSQEKPLNVEDRVPVPQTDTGGRV